MKVKWKKRQTLDDLRKNLGLAIHRLGSENYSPINRINQISDLLITCKKLEDYNQKNVWEEALNWIEKETDITGSYLIEMITEYAEGIRDRKYIDLDGYEGDKANSEYVFKIAEKFENLISDG